MTLKPPTRTLPHVVMKEWPKRRGGTIYIGRVDAGTVITPELLANMLERRPREMFDLDLSDFTRVVEETGILDQKETQRRKRASDHE